jgi:hypothetical protein
VNDSVNDTYNRPEAKLRRQKCQRGTGKGGIASLFLSAAIAARFVLLAHKVAGNLRIAVSAVLRVFGVGTPVSSAK